MTNARKKDVGQARNGGQFAATNRPEGDVELTAPEHDLTWWDEEERAFQASLYEAGLDGTLEPYNGDYPVNDGALRYWREGMTRELVIGELEDGTTVIAVEAAADEDISISENIGADPAAERIVEAVAGVKEQAAVLLAPKEH